VHCADGAIAGPVPGPAIPGQTVTVSQLQPVNVPTPVHVATAQPQFQVGAVNTNSCPFGSTRITDEATCRAAAIARGAEFTAETSPQYPAGCQTYQQPMQAMEVFLNSHPTGASEANSAPLCRTGVAAACHGPSSLALVGPGPVAVSDGPGDYADDMECVWNITSVGPITIVFKAFATEADYDFLTVVDGQSGDVLRRYTGETMPAVLRTNATSLRVVFTSDGGVSSGGFELEAFGLMPGGSWAPTAVPTTGSPTGAPTVLPTWAAATGVLWQ
jgi:hypothetical protein